MSARIRIVVGKFDVSASVTEEPKTEGELATVLRNLADFLEAPRIPLTEEEKRLI